MSEDQRYSKEGRAGWDPSKGSGHKGEKKQNVWVNNLRTILAETTNLDSDVRNIVNTILDHENIPRKKPKFVNFVKNIMRNRASSHSIDKTWELFSQDLNPSTKEEAPEETKMEVEEEKLSQDCDIKAKKEKKKKRKKLEEEGASEETEKPKKKSKKSKDKDVDSCASEETSEKENVETKKSKKKKKDKENDGSLKRKREEDTMEVDDDAEDVSPVKKIKFDWDETITRVLQQKGNEMKLNKLKKKCVSEFFALHEGTHKSQEEIGAKFDKKLKKKKYTVLKDRVKLNLSHSEDTNGDANGNSKAESEEPLKVMKESTETTLKPKETSFNNWESANLGSSAQNEKFRRLMGIKNPSKESTGKFGGDGRNDKKIFRDLEQGFEKARQMHFGGRSFNM